MSECCTRTCCGPQRVVLPAVQMDVGPPSTRAECQALGSLQQKGMGPVLRRICASA